MTNTPIIYEIYVDAFARGSSGRARGRRHGGDLEGVLERLDYVASLGATALWLTPIFASPSDHGYNITDYFRVDPRLAPDETPGAAEELFRACVEKAHRLGLGVLLDLPLNHVGHDYDLAAVPGEHKPRVRPARTRQERGWVRDLKYFDHDDEATRHFLFAVARHWVERYGVDGYRYDYVHGIANRFWEALYRELHGLGGDLFVIGEHWEDLGTPEENALDIGSRFDGESGPCFDTLFDFPFQAAAVEASSHRSPARLVEILSLCDRSYPRLACAMLDNHDTARVGDWVDGDQARLAMLLRLLASRAGPVCLLYGTETGLRSGRKPKRNVDESSRIPMDWAAAETSPLVGVCRAAVAARREAPAFVEGELVRRQACGDLFVELREGRDGRRSLALLNFNGVVLSAGTRVDALAGERLVASPLGGGDALNVEDGALKAPITPFGGGLYSLPPRDA